MIMLTSFSYKAQGEAPRIEGASLIVDCRSLANPHNVPQLRRFDGRHAKVQDFIKQDPRFAGIFLHARAFASRGMGLAFGCHGGRHRSVALVELLAERLSADGVLCQVRHTALD